MKAKPDARSRCGQFFPLVFSIYAKSLIVYFTGQGTTGVVYRARRKKDNLGVAVKTMRTNDPELVDIAAKE